MRPVEFHTRAVQLGMELVDTVRGGRLVGAIDGLCDFSLVFDAEALDNEAPIFLQNPEVQAALKDNDALVVKIVDLSIEFEGYQRFELFLDKDKPGLVGINEFDRYDPTELSQELKRRVDEFREGVCHDDYVSDEDTEEQLANSEHKEELLRSELAHQNDHIQLLQDEITRLEQQNERLLKDVDQVGNTHERLEREKVQWRNAFGLSHMQRKELNKQFLAAQFSILRLSLALRHAGKLFKQASRDATVARFEATRLKGGPKGRRLLRGVWDTVKTCMLTALTIASTIVLLLLVLVAYPFVVATPSILPRVEFGSCKQ